MERRREASAGAVALAERLALRDGSPALCVPGCWDPLTLRLVEQAGFAAGFVSGAAVTMAALGLPDLGYITGDQICEVVRAMRGVSELPLIVDGDTGFGNALTLRRFVRGLEASGASAVQVEDQVFPKRCGHLAGKQVVPLAQAIDRLRCTLDSRQDMLVVARTDVLAVHGLDSALERAGRFIEEGADLVFVEGGSRLEDVAAIGAVLGGRVPLIHNMVEGGGSPIDDATHAGALGFAVTLHPLMLMHGLVAQSAHWLGTLAQSGSTRGLGQAITDLAGMNALVRTSAILKEVENLDC